MGSVSVVRMLPLGRVHRRRELNLATCSWGLTKMNFILCRFSQSIIICQPDLRYFVFSNLLAMASEGLVRYGHFFLWMWVFFLWLKIHLCFSLWAVLKGINFFASRERNYTTLIFTCLCCSFSFITGKSTWPSWFLFYYPDVKDEVYFSLSSKPLFIRIVLRFRIFFHSL